MGPSEVRIFFSSLTADSLSNYYHNALFLWIADTYCYNFTFHLLNLFSPENDQISVFIFQRVFFDKLHGAILDAEQGRFNITVIDTTIIGTDSYTSIVMHRSLLMIDNHFFTASNLTLALTPIQCGFCETQALVQISVKNSNFFNLMAQGGMSPTFCFHSQDNSLIVENSVFDTLAAVFRATLLSSDGVNNSYTFRNISASNAMAGILGLFALAMSSNLTVLDSVFVFSQAQYGSVAYAQDSFVIFKNCSFSQIWTMQEGMFMMTTSYFEISNCVVDSSSGKKALFLSTVGAKIIMMNNSYQNQFGDSFIISNGNNDFDISNCSFTNSQLGLFLYNFDNSNFRIVSSGFYRITLFRASLFLILTGNNISISNCNFSDISSVTSGTLFSIFKNNTLIFDRIMCRNIESGDDAAILSSLSNNILQIGNSNFSTVVSSKEGGSFSLINSEISLSNCFFFNNSASFGGVLYLVNSNLTINNSWILNCSADFGSFIYAYLHVINIFNTEVRGNYIQEKTIYNQERGVFINEEGYLINMINFSFYGNCENASVCILIKNMNMVLINNLTFDSNIGVNGNGFLIVTSNCSFESLLFQNNKFNVLIQVNNGDSVSFRKVRIYDNDLNVFSQVVGTILFDMSEFYVIITKNNFGVLSSSNAKTLIIDFFSFSANYANQKNDQNWYFISIFSSYKNSNNLIKMI